jgi:hypothetical protein
LGRDYHITRADDWQRTDGVEITATEWRACVASDPDLVPDPENGPYAVKWTGHPEGDEDAWLDWLDGNIYTTEPDPPLLDKMLQLAVSLGARVVADDNRTYEADHAGRGRIDE